MSDTVCLVIPCPEAADELDRTLLSIVTQAGDFRVRVHVPHGAVTGAVARRLAAWQARLDDPQTPIQCRDIRFSHGRTPAAGLYAAIAQGIESISAGADTFMAWVREGDVFLPGALDHVAALGRQFTAQQVPWISGAAAQIRDHRLIAGVEVPTPTEVVAQGLCDGMCWPFLRQGGVFFRRGLWTVAKGAAVLTSDGFLEEWHLWQRFARHAKLVQSPRPLGAYGTVAQRLALHKRIQVRRGIDRTAPERQRELALRDLLGQGPLRRLVVADDAEGGRLRIVEQDISDRARRWFNSRFEAPLSLPEAIAPERVVHDGVWPAAAPPDRPSLASLTRTGEAPFTDLPGYRDLLHRASRDAAAMEADIDRMIPLGRRRATDPLGDPMWRANRIWAFDRDWQDRPATEWRGFRQIQALAQVPEGTGYVGYPWAGLIEAHVTSAPDLDRRRGAFRAFCAQLPDNGPRITICQHPGMMAHLDLFKIAGVTDVFWPHVTAQDRQAAALRGVRLHAFAQVAAMDAPERRTDGDRPVRLACSQARACLPLAADIGPGADCPERSRFALCPAGAGGNSLMLWQAIAAGAVPVILADAPGEGLPGDPELWQSAVVFCGASDQDLQTLTDRLATLEADPEQMQGLFLALDQLWLLYGPDALAHDIQILMAEHAGQAAAARSAPARIGHPPRIYYLGPRSARTPLGYAPFRRIAGGRIDEAPTPESADLILTGWNLDLAENAEALAAAVRANPSVKIAVISEEPLWDTVWSGGFADRDRQFDCGGTMQPYRALNHMNSRIFDFADIPYFLLTADHFAPRYVSMLAKYVHMRPRDMLEHWQDAPLPLAFVAECRTDPIFDVTFDDGRIQGLSHYRTAVAGQVRNPDALRLGQGWPGQGARRQALPDWHLDKLARLQGRTRFCGAYENTHQHSYVSEKIVDAFAVGAMPICYAGPGHRLHDLVLPEAMINTYGLPAAGAARRIEATVPDLAAAEAWLETAADLRARLGNATTVMEERRRVVDEVLAEIFTVL
ncbi:hypothetical protein [Sulfitobacter sabulilitoris]|uniref:Uncharacterized protein n=1 Tax=Sulfitobacter sabulilitoris TaxID=2562655 RepID=A0A5S3P7M1_9RHOB|nr:hypothetical protein [Sulfitobacter sabulilitoris]TMM49388.1 hypothetical protein FDT80_18280 [Sulfitobacter sabulilitoris]